jgi:tetratricopeptide (TPR) repeat protein
MGVKRQRAKESSAGGPGQRRNSLGGRNKSLLLHGDPGAVGLRDAVGWVSILCATLLAYLPALRGGLLWDDSSHVTRLDLQSLHGLWRIWFDLGATQQYYPLLHSAFWMEHRMWGDAVLGYHLTNVTLHAASACLVVMIVRRLSLPGAWLAGLVFALHPVSVEAVAWISEQKSTLSGVFYLASALAYLRFDQSRRASRYWLALGLFVLALLTKTVTATLPAVLLVVLWWQRGRLEWKRDLRPLLPWFALGASAGLFTAWVERTLIGAKGADFTLTLLQRCLLAGRAICFYAGKLLWPRNLTFIYPRWNIDPGEWWQYLFPAGVLALAIGLWLVARRHRGPLAGFLIFAGTLFPVLGFLNVYPFRYSYVADHFQYLASLGLIVPIASVWAILAGRVSPGMIGRIAFAAVPLVTLGALTWEQSGIYRDTETLYRETLVRNPGSWLAHNNLGTSLLEIPGRRAEAMAHFEAALRIKPDYSEAHLSLGNALLQIPGRLADAIAEYQTAVRLDPDSERAHNNLGHALLQAGRPQEAIAQLETALRIRPAYAEAHNNLGNALSQMPGRLPDAMAEYQAAIRLDPHLPEAHNNLGRALAQVPGRMPDAIAQFEAAINIRPDYAGAHDNLGNALSEMPGRLPDAIAEYQAALRINPDFVQAHINLGNALLHTGQTAGAIVEYEAAVRLQPNPEVQRLLERLKAGQK